MTKEAGKTYIEKFKVHSKEMEGLLEKYQAALQQLQQVFMVCIFCHIQNNLLKIDFKQNLHF